MHIYYSTILDTEDDTVQVVDPVGAILFCVSRSHWLLACLEGWDPHALIREANAWLLSSGSDDFSDLSTELSLDLCNIPWGVGRERPGL